VRHRNAQLAGRASIEYYVGQALKNYKPPSKTTSAADDEGIDCEAYIMRVFENGIVVFIPRFGIEGRVLLEDFKIEGGKGGKRESEYDAEEYRLGVWEKGAEGKVVVELFEMVRVKVSSVREEGGRSMGKRKVRVLVVGK
jgi:exosome complex exonuclease DIS3/RRP44